MSEAEAPEEASAPTRFVESFAPDIPAAIVIPFAWTLESAPRAAVVKTVGAILRAIPTPTPLVASPVVLPTAPAWASVSLPAASVNDPPATIVRPSAVVASALEAPTISTERAPATATLPLEVLAFGFDVGPVALPPLPVAYESPRSLCLIAAWSGESTGWFPPPALPPAVLALEMVSLAVAFWAPIRTSFSAVRPSPTVAVVSEST